MKNKLRSLLITGCLTVLVMAVSFLNAPTAQAAEVHLNNSITKPYYLNQAGSTYILDEDITAEGTAFVFDENNITLDLNGHAVTFGNIDLHVLNADFEEGGDVPLNWDFSAAPNAKRLRAIDQPMVNSWAVQFTNLTASESIVSDWITISNPNRTYMANVMYSGIKPTVQVEFQDGRVVATGVSPYQESVEFKPSKLGFAEGQYRLRVIVPTTANCWIDLADLRPFKDAGVMQYPYNYTEAPDLPTAPGNHINHIVKNGLIKEGVGHGYKFRSLVHAGTGRFEVDHINTEGIGIDSSSLYNVGQNNVIHDSNFSNLKPTVINRMALDNFAVLMGSNSSFFNNQLMLHAGGISLGGDVSNVEVYNNTFQNTGNVTNHYSVETFANSGHQVSDIRIHNNRFEAGSGIFFSSNTANSQVYDNYFNLVATPCNSEYNGELHTVGIRIYDYAEATVPVTYNNKIHHNLIEGKAQAYSQFPKCKPGIVGIKTATSVNSPNEYYNNEIHVYREDTASLAVSFSALGPNLSGIHDNYFESNEHNVIYGDRFAGLGDNGIYTSNTFVKRTTPISTDYHTIDTEWCCNPTKIPTTNHQYVGSKLANGASIDDLNFNFSTGTNYEHDVQWFLNIETNDSAGNSLSGADISIIDQNGQSVYVGQTDASGKVSAIPLRQFIRSGKVTGSTSTSNYVYSTPHQITVSKAGMPTEIQTITMDANKELTIILDGAASEPAIISDPAVMLNRTDKTATITWRTDQLTSSRVNWGVDANYGQVLSSDALTTNHVLTINNITAGNYHFQVSGLDSSGKKSESADQTFFYLSETTSRVILTKSVDKSSVTTGDIITYTLTYINGTGSLISNVRIEDPIPAGTTFISASDSGNYDGSKVIWNLGNIDIGVSKSITFQVKVQ